MELKKSNEQMENDICSRLEHFKYLNPKRIIYGSEVPGDIVIKYMDEIYGHDGYTIYVSILPCMSQQLVKHINREMKKRSNVEYLPTEAVCIRTDGSNGVAISSPCANAVKDINLISGLEVCGCDIKHASAHVPIWDSQGYTSEINEYSVTLTKEDTTIIMLFLSTGFEKQFQTLGVDDFPPQWRVNRCKHK